MGKLKKDNLNVCLSILKEFVDDSSSQENQKERAILALEQLQRITAGVDGADIFCLGRPRADGASV